KVNSMVAFIRSTFATVLGIFIFLLLGGFLVWIFTPKDDAPDIKESSVLRLSLNAPIEERSQEDPFTKLTGNVTPIGLLDLLQVIEKAKEDDNIKGIYIDTQVALAGFASLEEIRGALLDFKESGKFIIAYAEYYSEGAYYIASVADQIFVNPIGLVEFNGLSVEVPFIKGTLEKLGVKPIIFRVGDYKSAVEPLMREEMSEASREQTTSYLNSIYDHYLNKVATSRNIPLHKLTIISDSMLVRKAKDALKYKLVTDVGYEDEARTALRKQLKIEDDEKINFVSIDTYKKVVKAEKEYAKNKIAIIVAEGQIVDGKGGDGTIGSVSFVKELRKVRKNDKVKAVILRINSPGGSALASDVMWREIQLLRKEKPVIASMSDVAASGGYYMAMGCNSIVAQPNTITGSIGIFGVLFNAQELLNEKIGVTADRVNTGGFSDLGNPTRELSETEKQIIQANVNRGYETFTSKAAKGRNMKVAALKKIASGRVWSGEQAKGNGLVDELGGIAKAVEMAVKEADLKEEEYMLKYYPIEKDFFTKLLESMNEAKAITLQEELGEFYDYYLTAKQLRKLKGIQARLPYDIVIK
ncbi:MAG: signal peptide peptidase SppA, partial [Bacteroidota bacterium]